MPVSLTLGLPDRRDRQGLTDGLLLTPSAVLGTHIGPPVVAPADYDGSTGDVIVRLASNSAPIRDARIVRTHVDVCAEGLGAALALRGPLAVFVSEPDADTTRAIVAAGHSAGIAATEPADRIADFLAVIAHTDVGFVGRACGGAHVVQILAATVAALRGDNVRRALVEPNVSALIALNPAAGEAVREVLLGIEIDDVDEASDYLRGAGLL